MSGQDEETTNNGNPDRKRFSKKRLCFLLVLTLTILMVVLFFVFSAYHTPGFNTVLTWAKLAPLPESAQNLKVDTRPVISRGRVVPYFYSLCIKFQADPNDINDFIANSPGLDKSRCRPLVVLLRSDDVPTWWSTDQTTSGRAYTCIKQKDIDGAIFVYDDSHTVRISLYYVANPQIRDAEHFLEDLKDNVEDFIDNLIHEVSDVFGH